MSVTPTGSASANCAQTNGSTCAGPRPGGLDLHSQCLQMFCRICGGKFKSNSGGSRTFREKIHPCQGYRDQLKEILGVDVECDHNDINPPSMCQSCYCEIMIHKKKPNIKNVKQWAAHPRIGICDICHTQKSGKPGRKKKKPNMGAKNLPKSFTETTSSIKPLIDNTKYTVICKSCSNPIDITNISQHTCTHTDTVDHDHTYAISHNLTSLTNSERERIAKEVVQEKIKESPDGATIILTGGKRTQVRNDFFNLFFFVA